ncbi:MAG TPA: fibronectin type III domain-containing protein, partial [Bacteroidales bacterium]|nr:fibronectin type III domain-containing protein [Bacteroidales bacterium]
MKRSIINLIRYTFVAVLVTFTGIVKGQIGSFEISVRNITQTASNRLEFDVYLLDADPLQPFQLASCQLGFLLNSLIHAGGTLSAAIDNTGSGLNASQQFSATPSVATGLAGYPNQTLIRLAGRTPPGAGNGTIISTTGSGTLLTHFILTSSVDFAESSTPDITFTSSSATTPLYPTRVNIYDGTNNIGLVVTPGTNAIVYGNPILNPPVPVAPVANAAENITCTGFTASWQASSGAVSYRLDVSTVEDFSDFVNGYKDLDVGEELKYEVTGLTGSTSYYYRVRAVNAYGASANSNTISCLTSPPVPSAPSAQAGSGAVCTQFTANWSASA